jgi:hypothetical protein
MVACGTGGCALAYASTWLTVLPSWALKSAVIWVHQLAKVAMFALIAAGATWLARAKTPLSVCIVGRRTEAGLDMLYPSPLVRAFSTLMAVLVSCQISQKAVAEPSLDAAVLLGVGLAVWAGLPLGAGLPLAAGVLLGVGLLHADSAKARAAVINGAASNESRPVVRDVRSMPVVDVGKAPD